jgi:TldD protein
MGQKRLVRMTNTYLYPAPGAPWVDSLEKLVEGIPFGVYLEGSMGGAVSKEGMSTTIQTGRVIRDGKLTGELLLPANLTVRTLGSLKGVEAFAGPLRCDDPGFCGKGQTKTVTDGGPMTRFRKTEDITLGF